MLPDTCGTTHQGFLREESCPSGSRTRMKVTMPRAARSPHDWLILVMALFAVLIWGSRALEAILMAREPSGRALFACVALVIAGFLVGMMAWILGAPKRARRPRAEGLAVADDKALFPVLALGTIGLGTSPIVDASTGAWGWAGMIGLSLVGGMHLGIFVMMSADQRSSRDTPTPAAPTDA